MEPSANKEKGVAEAEESELASLVDVESTFKADPTSPRLTSRDLVDIYFVYFSVFLDNMGVSIVQPILPFYAEQFGANGFQLGMLYSAYSLPATFATMFMAKMSDRFG